MQVRIISLGEIVTPDVRKTIREFTAVIAAKKPLSNAADIGKSISMVLQNNMYLIDDFKCGKLCEKDFTEQMIAALKKATEIELKNEEFDVAWNKMNPTFEQFKTSLNQAIEYNSQPNQKVILISATNPKDIRHLIEELKANEQNYISENDQLIEIGGIKLFTTYAAQKSKAELIETIIKQLNAKPLSRCVVANSMNAVFTSGQSKTIEPINIKYIRCVNDIKDQILKNDLDKTNQEVEKSAAYFSVETLLWKKCEQQTLSDVLNNNQLASKRYSVSVL